MIPTPGPWCLSTEPELSFIQALAHLGVAISYAVIAVLISRFVWKKPELNRHPFFYIYAAFIMLCGLTHAIAVYTRYVAPTFIIETFFLLLTAGISIVAFVITPSSLKAARAQIHANRADKARLVAEAAEARMVLLAQNQTDMLSMLKRLLQEK